MSDNPLFCVGKSVTRKDALAKASGEALYIDDYSYGGMLHAAAVRSPRPHIRIKGFDARAAEKVPGFVMLVSAADIPGKNIWPVVKEDCPFFPETESRFQGETLALVLAETRLAAREAAAKVKVLCAELPFVEDPLAALEKSAPKIYGGNNVFSSYVIKRGDVEGAIRSADAVVEGVFTTNYQVHVYLETQGAIAFPEAGGAMTVYGSLQCPYYAHDAVAQALNITHNKVRIVQRVTGGGFGGKEDVPALVAAHAAIAARKSGRPVKLVYERDEDFISMSRRHPSWTRMLYAARKDGAITACKAKYVLDGGAYATLSPIVLWRGTVHAAGPYKIENVSVESFAAATNKAPCGAYRGFGQPQICFANESLLDELAEKLGMDPLELRLKNILRPGDKTITGQVITGSCGLEEALLSVREKSGWAKRRGRLAGEGPVKRGLGVSANYYGVGLGAGGKYLDRAGAHVSVSKDGSVYAAVGNTEMGQGAQTVLSQIAAETLNCPYDGVRMTEVDTSRVPDSGPTVASRTTLMSGNAIIDACKPLRGRIFKAARELLSAKGAPEGKMEASGGEFRAGGKVVGFMEAVKECWAQRLKMAEHGWYVAPKTSFLPENGQGDAYVTYAYSANVAEVAVDTETGAVRVEKLYAAHDLGRAVNPRLALGQMHGGALQGIGYALSENLVYKDGALLNPNMSDYVLPSSMETPEFDCSTIERPYEDGPYAAKGFGETPLIGPAPAIANAVKDACGARVPGLPLMPEKVWKALKDKA